ncbi:MAG: quinate 5-dehydrogenase [Anaerolineae bacterium]
MKRVVSISLGSSRRDHKVAIELLGEQVSIERIGTDGDVEMARQLYRKLDGKVDAFGMGGTDLTLRVGGRHYPLYQARKLVEDVRHTPVVDGGGLKHTLERRVMQYVEAEIGTEISPKRALITMSVDRYGMALSFEEAGYQTIYGDFMFGLGLPFPLRSLRAVRLLAWFMLPVFGRLPMHMVYPTGEKQQVNIPKWEKYYRWASVVAGDFLYIRRHMPQDMAGKVIVTNTTTQADLDFLAGRGVKYLVTTTPRLEGRSFGTNVMEAALVAISGKSRPLTDEEIEEMLAVLGFRPSIEKLSKTERWMS